MFQMDIAGRDEGVYAGPLSVMQSSRCPLHIEGTRTRESCNLHPGILFADCINSFEVSLRSDRKAGFQYVDAEIHELRSHFQLFGRSHTAARRLLAIAQSGIKYIDAAQGVLLFFFENY